MGILCLAAYLRSKLDVDLLLMDQRVENASVEAVVRRAADFGADVVGLSVMTPYSSNLGLLTEGLRAALPEAFIVLGGPHVSAFEAEALAGNVADAAVPFEGECALEQVVRARQEGADLTSIPGLLWRNGGPAINRNPGSIPFIEDIDALPFPAYDLLDVRKYWRLQPMQTATAAQIHFPVQQPGLSVQVHLLSCGIRKTVSGAIARAAGRRNRAFCEGIWGHRF